MIRKPHKQKWIKVNAPVDEGIADLIEALSLFPKLQTRESCQRNTLKGMSVSFTYGENAKWEDLTKFVFEYFGRELTRELGDRIDIYVRIDGTFGNTMAHLTVHSDCLKRTIKVIKTLARRFKD